MIYYKNIVNITLLYNKWNPQNFFFWFVYFGKLSKKQCYIWTYFSLNKWHWHLCSICFKVKYFLNNLFSFSGVCLQAKYNQTCKIFSVDHKILYKIL